MTDESGCGCGGGGGLEKLGEGCGTLIDPNLFCRGEDAYCAGIGGTGGRPRIGRANSGSPGSWMDDLLL